MVTRGELVVEGKTKKIWEAPHESGMVLIESKDDVTAGDGARREQFESKGKYSTDVAVRCFELLNARAIPNHFVARVDSTTFLAQKLEMIPIEVVLRRVVTGSYLNRRPDIEEGTRFDPPVVECFTKIDMEHDPLMIHDFVSQRVLLFDKDKPLVEVFLREVPMKDRDEEWLVISRLIWFGEHVFTLLEEAWSQQGVTLVDLKIEGGRAARGDIILGDVITNDEWRIWPGGDKSRQLDKQKFREMPEATKEAMAALKANYAQVAEMVKKFPKY